MSMNKARRDRLMRLVNKALKIYPAPLPRKDKLSAAAVGIARAIKTVFVPLEEMIEKLNSSREAMIEKIESISMLVREGGAP